MSKLYFVSWRTLTQAERMEDKIKSLLDKKGWELIEAPQEDEAQLIKEIDTLNAKRDEIRNALDNVTSQRKAEWKYIEILKQAEVERGLLDNILNINF